MVGGSFWGSGVRWVIKYTGWGGSLWGGGGVVAVGHGGGGVWCGES